MKPSGSSNPWKTTAREAGDWRVRHRLLVACRSRLGPPWVCSYWNFLSCFDPNSDRESRSTADRALNGNRSAMTLDDAVGNRQAQSGALTDGLGRKERIEDPRQLIRGNATTAIADGHLYRITVLPG